MEWLLRLIAEHWGAAAALVALPFVVWAELSNFRPGRGKKTGESR